MQALEGKTALVTGASGGLGPHVVKALLDAGAVVVGTSRKISDTVINHPHFSAVAGDLSSSESAATVVEKALARLSRLDILAHIVGGFAGGQPVETTTGETFSSMFELNFYSLLYTVQAALPALRRSGSGRLIAIGSRAALEPGAGVSAYGASKAAAVSLIRTLAAENRDAGMTANAILPGTMDTPANRRAMPDADTSRWVRPENVASLLVWLAGEAGKDVNGALLPVYGRD